MKTNTFLSRCRFLLISLLAIALLCLPANARQTVPSPKSQQTSVIAAVEADVLQISNNLISAGWSISSGKLKFSVITDKRTERPTPNPREVFSLTVMSLDSTVFTYRASDMKIIGKPRVEDLKGDPKAPRQSEQFPGKQIVVQLESQDGLIPITWSSILREGSDYLRQEMTIAPIKKDLMVTEITFIDASAANASLTGTVRGTPVVAGEAYLGFEHPLSQSVVDGESVRCSLRRETPIKAGQKFTCSSVIGFTPPGQLRRGFNSYVERERAHPYRTFLHYNSWYDIGYFTPYDEKAAVDVINMYGTELVVKRGVKLSSFLFDDGWDNQESLWDFNKGFPNGFTPLKEAAAKYGSAPGVWLSPYGGYGEPRNRRIEFGKKQGYETNPGRGDFALSGPIYFKRISQVCLDMITKYGVNQFKFDGVGESRGVVAGSEFGSNFEAAIALIDRLRVEKPDLYVNLTTGTWPSPFWLRYADSIWRGGSDHSFRGVGSNRQRWITYRDSDTYRGIVKKGTLFPLTSLMLHGLIYAKNARNLSDDPQNDFTSEVRSYFGSGTQQQEMYVTPSLLTQKNWDDLAEAAKWSQQNADIFVDVHWVGGDPGELVVYGWAAWSPRKGILTLRNPSDQPQSIIIDIDKVFELPGGAPTQFTAKSPWEEDKAKPEITLAAGTPKTIELKPFEVINLDLIPVKK
jgi:hypothetical protein